MGRSCQARITALPVAAGSGEGRGLRVAGAGVLLALALTTSARGAEITVYRCEDAAGRVTLQDDPCAQGQQQSERRMTRPQDPPPARPRPAPEPSAPSSPAADARPAPTVPPAPPPMYRCTDYDGDVRHTEEFAPNTRCVPLPALGYDVRGNPAAASTCRWVQESCLRLDDAETCRQFKAKLRQAESDALHAFSDTAAYRRSEVERLRGIVARSCN
ncbi:DUF4124 domain-containing protein [Arenimonas composti]|uniref:DUF4124 domain-containing protein n=1 Tax=Arenimonas composti TR7-09 = DSM 18010 TaxID=1121013 RepID=A0A091BB47_9GAMM|nr:DUF4124 domain-containing protein [Arenimonas composti]KFN49883.1 hypothetical protein P873_08550 [Arenimonas composti TR7-09 = DSM 18010]